MIRQSRVAALGGLICLLCCSWAGAQTTQTSGPASTGPTTDAVRKVQMEMEDIGAQLSRLIPSPTLLVHDSAKRHAIAPSAIPLISRMIELLAQADNGDPELHKRSLAAESGLQSQLVFFGDDATENRLQSMLDNPAADPARVLAARVSLTVGRWMRSCPDAATQEKALQQFEQLAHSYNTEPLVIQAASMMGMEGAANDQMQDKLIDIIQNEFKDGQTREIVFALRSRQKQLKQLNQPLVLKGTSLVGSAVSTDEWKGKMVIVNFSAVAVPSCLVVNDDLKKIYAQYHDRGVEIVTISCDNDPAQLRDYLSHNPEIKWPVLVDGGHPGMHPLAAERDIQALPTVYIIDREGILRSVELMEPIESLLLKLDPGLKPTSAPSH